MSGLLARQLAGLLAAIQEARLFPDSKTAVCVARRRGRRRLARWPRPGSATDALRACCLPPPPACNSRRGCSDLVLKQPPAEVAACYARAVAAAAAAGGGAAGHADAGPAAVSRAALQELVDACLAPAGSDVEACVAPDWRAEPPGFLPQLQQAAAARGADASEAAALRAFGLRLNELWGLLCRRVRQRRARQRAQAAWPTQGRSR